MIAYRGHRHHKSEDDGKAEGCKSDGTKRMVQRWVGTGLEG